MMVEHFPDQYRVTGVWGGEGEYDGDESGLLQSVPQLSFEAYHRNYLLKIDHQTSQLMVCTTPLIQFPLVITQNV